MWYVLIIALTFQCFIPKTTSKTIRVEDTQHNEKQSGRFRIVCLFRNCPIYITVYHVVVLHRFDPKLRFGHLH